MDGTGGVDGEQGPARRGPDRVEVLLALINGESAAMATTYAATGSIPITVVAGAAALLLALLFLLRR